MELKTFKHINNIGGWLAFFIASVVYTLTMESTASLWDCGEFIASSYKLQVVHPPGAALFLMIGRMFTLLAGGNEALVSLSMNFMSALCSGFAMMFLFWITTHLARRLLGEFDGAENMSLGNVTAIIGAGAIAALTGTFCDSVWFSAVEGEVYSMSLGITGLVVWLMLKWEEHADEPYADKWLLLIAFIMGCSIFVHWLNLLTIPALVLVYYFKRHKPTLRGVTLAFFISLLILGFIYKGVITTIIGIAAKFELFFVNEMGMPFRTGAFIFFSLLAALIFGGLWYARKSNRPAIFNVLAGVMFILIGYSTITTIVIRSNAEPSIDMNSPRDLVSLSTYLLREQYGSRPFLTGYFYTAKINGMKEVGQKYQKGEKKYDEVGKKLDYEYQGKKRFFPRMHDPSHKENYEKWLGHNKKPSYWDNIRFFFKYQIGHMYVRYMMWNFVGRQNDEQGLGGVKNGNWLSGIGFLDSMRLGSQSNLPDGVKNHPSRNTYYFLPLFLGLLGFVFHFSNDRRRAVVVLLLFFFTGLSIVIQGNSPPIEPRERDYIFAASFWAFCIWIGLGMIAVYELLKSKLGGRNAALAALAICLIPPALMGFQNWDDHDRSGRFAARDFAANYLNSLAPNAIIFTQGDNDTYPLWYAQEVENIRRDVRVVNLSLLGVDWYINQLRRKTNDAAIVPMTLSPDKIRGSKRDISVFIDNPRIVPEGEFAELRQIMDFIGDDRPGTKHPERRDLDYYPTRKLKLTVDKAALRKNNAISPDDVNKMQPELRWQLNKTSLYKNDLMVLDIIAANNWKYPIYFAISVSPSSYMGLEKYFQLEGLAYRLVPIATTEEDRSLFGSYGRPNPDVMYDNLMNKFRFGNIDNPGVHVDVDLRRMALNLRGNFARLAEALNQRGDHKRAIEVLDHSLEVMPDNAAPYDFYMLSTIQSYYDAKAFDKANELADFVTDRLVQELKYYKGISSADARLYEQDKRMAEQFFQIFAREARKNKLNDFAKKLEDKLKGI